MTSPGTRSTSQKRTGQDKTLQLVMILLAKENSICAVAPATINNNELRETRSSAKHLNV